MGRYCSIIFFLCSFLSSFGQINSTYRLETFASSGSGKSSPFWLVNQKWGTVPLDANNYYIRGSVFYDHIINDDWSLDGGLDLMGSNRDHYSHFWVQQIYGRINWKIWRLDIGSREDYISFLNPYLSSGDFIHSNNARPIPQIRVSLSEFVLMPYTKGNLYLKGDFSMGYFLDGEWQEENAWVANQDYVKKELSHNKSIFFRFGNIEVKNNMQFIIGIQHATKWGGELYKYRYIDGKMQYYSEKQPKGIDDFWRVMIAKEGSSSSSPSDNAYVAGSQWGAYLLKYDYKLKNNNILSFYMQHFFDDGSGMTFENYRDNLLGLEFKSSKKSWISGVVFEYVYTKQQTGPIHHNLQMDEEHKHLKNKGNGNDNYYNNADYVSGPSHFGKSFGTPLFLSPEYNRDGSLNFKSNRIIAFHLGLEGYLASYLNYRVLLTTGQSWGRYYVPFTEVKKGFASQFEVTYKARQIEDFDVKLAVGFDNGKFFGGNTFGGAITLTKRGVILKK